MQRDETALSHQGDGSNGAMKKRAKVIKKELPGAKMQPPEGFKTVVDAIRYGIEMEKAGASTDTTAKALKYTYRAYACARDIVLLSERKGFPESDTLKIQTALSMFIESRQITNAWNLIAPIARKLWGSRGHRFKSDVSRVDSFMSSVSIVVTTCEAANEIELPYLNQAQRTHALLELEDAKDAIIDLQKRIRKEA